MDSTFYTEICQVSWIPETPNPEEAVESSESSLPSCSGAVGVGVNFNTERALLSPLHKITFHEHL